MNKFLTTTAIASAFAFPAMADDTDITQTVGALQAALNSILINFDGTGVTQASTNAANLINYTTDDLDDVLQSTDPDDGGGGLGQFAINSLVSTGGFSGGVFTGSFDDIDQDATNVANSIEALNLEDLTQDIDEAAQIASNTISGPTGISDFDQSAVNAGNLATLNSVEIDLIQDVDDTVQNASNSAVSSVGNIVMGDDNSQAATNVLNSATVALDVGDDIFQTVDDATQSASNLLSNGGFGNAIDNFDQSAVNAANLITVDSVGDDVNQDVDDLDQIASNVANSTGEISNGAQAATNVANSLTVAGAVDDDITQSVSEFFFIQPVSQTASNVADADLDVSGMTQDAVNAANLASAASVGDNVTQYAYDLDQDASNLSFAFFGDIIDVDQAATNVVNSLTLTGDIGGNVNQDFGFSSQTAGNTLDGVLSITGSTQAAVNAANLATLMTVDGDIYQSVYSVDQLATNDALLVVGSIADSSQEATNVANSVTAEGAGLTVSTLDQDTFDVTQIASNNIGASPIQGNVVTSVSNVDQTAVNAANLATLQDVEVELDQSFDNTGQLAINTVVAVTPFSGGIANLTQAATNVANSATLDDIFIGAELNQTADMSGFLNGQAALNYVEFGIDGVTDVSQAATNAVNLATLDELRGTLSQTVTNGAQVAGNLVNYAGSTASAPFFDSAGTVSGLNQTAVNAANLVTVGSLPDLSSTLEVSQSYSGFQLAGNGLYDADTINNVTQAATNVANSISNPSAP